MSKVAPGSSYDNPLKVVVLGNGPGKSAAVLRLVLDRFVEDHDPTLADWYRHKMGNVYLDIYDTASCDGENDFACQAKASHAVLVMFSVASGFNFDNLGEFFCTLEMFHHRVPFVLVGTQIDRVSERQVSVEEAQALAAAHGAPYMETSAKTGQGVREVFQLAINLALENYNSNTPKEDTQETHGKRCTIQ